MTSSNEYLNLADNKYSHRYSRSTLFNDCKTLVLTYRYPEDHNYSNDNLFDRWITDHRSVGYVIHVGYLYQHQHQSGFSLMITRNDDSFIQLPYEQLMIGDMNPYVLSRTYSDNLTYDNWKTLIATGILTSAAEPVVNSTLTYNSFKKRLLTTVNDDNRFIFHGQSISNLIEIAKMTSPNHLIIKPSQLVGHTSGGEVIIIEDVEDCSNLNDKIEQMIPNNKIIFVTEKSVEQISDWELLELSDHPFNVIEFSESVPKKVVHRFYKF